MQQCSVQQLVSCVQTHARSERANCCYCAFVEHSSSRAAAAEVASIVYAAWELSLPLYQSERHATAAQAAIVQPGAQGSVVAFTLKQCIGSLFCVVPELDHTLWDGQ
eukprot:17755-Heterococcus_DN1.PRE.1